MLFVFAGLFVGVLGFKQVPVDQKTPVSSIHDIIGIDGALVLTLERFPERFRYAAGKLSEAGIIATPFPAADGLNDAEEELTRGCFHVDNPDTNLTYQAALEDQMFAKIYSGGFGCGTRNDAACTESHHRALEAAQYRQSDWTLIMEDDAIPVEPANFATSFRDVWPKVPKSAKFVRLGWCTFPAGGSTGGNPKVVPKVSQESETSGTFTVIKDFAVHADADDIQLLNEKNYDAGLCATAYMVHRSVIREVLGIFPCICLIDCCLSDTLFDRPVGANGETWGQLNMVSIDIADSAGVEISKGWNRHPDMLQFGPLVQDNREIPASRLLLSQSNNASMTAWQKDMLDTAAEIKALMYVLTK